MSEDGSQMETPDAEKGATLAGKTPSKTEKPPASGQILFYASDNASTSHKPMRDKTTGSDHQSTINQAI